MVCSEPSLFLLTLSAAIDVLSARKLQENAGMSWQRPDSRKEPADSFL